jgi:hypothetical protein
MPDGIEKDGFRPDHKIEDIAGWHVEITGLLSSPVCNRDRVIEVESISVDGS